MFSHTVGEQTVHKQNSPTSSETEWAQIAEDIERFDKESDSKKTPGILQNFSKKIRHNKKVSFGQNTIKIITETTEVLQDKIKVRGVRMTEEKEKISTPVSIEYNIPDGQSEFNIIEECEKLFTFMSIDDPSIRVLDSKNRQVLWEPEGQLPETDIFTTVFRMREQNFRQGNKKVTIYAIVEGQYTINKLKFRNPLQGYLLEKNVWIKPDYYSTQIVSSPGYITLLHPKLTNKESLIKTIKENLETIMVDESEEVVKNWKRYQAGRTSDIPQAVPDFHLETTQKKWGQLQAEVLSLHCSKEDSSFLKYLCVEAGAQGVFTRGVFVPAGIHLLEGKEVVSDILRSQQTFLAKVTGFQIDGISKAQMTQVSSNEKTVGSILQNGPGVHSIEPTFRTENKGQWIIVVEKSSIQNLTKYITENLSSIYSQSGRTQPRLITYQQENNRTKYKMVMVDKNLARVGSYAEVLKRRFTPVTENKGDGITGLEQETFHNSSDTMNHKTGEYSLHGTHTKPIVYGEKAHQDGSKAETSTSAKSVWAQPTTTAPTQKPTDKLTDTIKTIQTTQNQLKDTNTRLELAVDKKLQEMNEQTTIRLSEFEDRLTSTIETILENKILEVSSLIANTITKRVILLMNSKIQNVRKTDTDTNESVTVTQQSPIKQTHEADTDIDTEEHNKNKADTSVHNTKKMLDALKDIDSYIDITKDSPHDNPIESMTEDIG